MSKVKGPDGMTPQEAAETAAIKRKTEIVNRLELFSAPPAAMKAKGKGPGPKKALGKMAPKKKAPPGLMAKKFPKAMGKKMPPAPQ